MRATCKGADALAKRLGRVAAALPGRVGGGVERALNNVQKVAAAIIRGQIGRSLEVELLDRAGKTLAGRVFNDTKALPWSSFVEFGTGILVDDQGNDEAIRLKRAKSVPWYIHVSMVPPDFARYGHRLVVGRGGEQYYEVWGMRPHPYLHPAAFATRDDSLVIIGQAVAKTFEEVLR